MSTRLTASSASVTSGARSARSAQNLPAERDTFVGRVAELRALAARLDAGTRLLTVLGPGGTGKTRFVRRYGRIWLGDWPGGVYFCDLSEARSLDGIFFAVASALGVPLGKDDPAVQLGHAIAGRGRCLVILDNFEQVVQHAPATLGRWLDRAPQAAFVVTSRERLHLPGEEIFPLEPLPLEKDAIELFATRARAQVPSFVLGEANRAAVAEVVRLLDGLPLAIELAAARVRVLSPAQLVERMRDRFSLLAGARGAAARQATLRAAIDWSWELLTPWEQAAFAQCSIFEGGFTLEAAEAVLDLSAWPEAPPAMDVVQALADKSLLRTWVPAEQSRYDIEEPYFGMYLSIHEYAAEKLEASGRDGETGNRGAPRTILRGLRHRRSDRGDCRGTAASSGAASSRSSSTISSPRAAGRCGAPTASTRSPRIWRSGKCSSCRDHARWGSISARRCSRSTRSMRRSVPRHCRRAPRRYRRAGRSEEAATGFEQALALSREIGDRRREASILVILGNLRRDQGRMDDARAHARASLAIAREVGNRRLEGNLIGNLGILHAVQGRLEEARAHFEQALAIHREVGNRRIEGIDTSNLGNVYREQGKLEEAGAHFQQALAIHREVGNRRDEGVVIGNLGLLCSDQGRLDDARELCEDALAICREVGDRLFEGVMLGDLANVLRDQGRMAEARAHLDQALAIHRAVGNRRAEGSVLGSLGELLAREGRFDEARELLRQGEALLREVGDQLGLAVLLCDRGHAEVAGGDVGAARTALAAAETVARDDGRRTRLRSLAARSSRSVRRFADHCVLA